MDRYFGFHPAPVFLCYLMRIYVCLSFFFFFSLKSGSSYPGHSMGLARELDEMIFIMFLVSLP